MKPLFLILAAALSPWAASAAVSDAYLNANKEYSAVFFSYIESKNQIRVNLLAHQDAVSSIPKKQAEVQAAKSALSQHRSTKATKEQNLKTEQSNLVQVKKQLEDATELGRQDLDNPNNDDIVKQLQQRKSKLDKDAELLQTEIDIEKRKIDRVKRSPEYVFYVKEIDQRKQRFEQLEREQNSLNQEISLIASEISRLQSSLDQHKRNKLGAEQIIPNLRADLERANKELTAAQQSGDAFAIQVAESKFRQAHLNLRRTEVQLDEANLGINETTGQIEKKNKLQDDKKALLNSVVANKDKVRTEWKDLHEAFQDYHKQNLAAFEDRWNELKSKQESIRKQADVSAKLAQNITTLRENLTSQTNKVAAIAEEIKKLDTVISGAEKNVQQAEAEFESAKVLVSTTKDQYNKSIQDSTNNYDLYLKKQKSNDDALKAATISAQVGLL